MPQIQTYKTDFKLLHENDFCLSMGEDHSCVIYYMNDNVQSETVGLFNEFNANKIIDDLNDMLNDNKFSHIKDVYLNSIKISKESIFNKEIVKYINDNKESLIQYHHLID